MNVGENSIRNSIRNVSWFRHYATTLIYANRAVDAVKSIRD